MKRLFLLFLLLPACLFSQKPEEKSTVSFGAQTGFNLSKIKNDTLDVRNVLLPFLGINLRYQAAPKFNIQAGIQYSFRGANVKVPFKKFRNDYIDIQLLGMYSIFSELRVQAGIQYAMSLSSSLQKSMMKSIVGENNILDRNYPAQFEIIAGLEVTAHKILNIGFLYTIPLKKMDYANLQFVFRVNLFEPKPGKKEKENK